jgi:hypothetical protein
VLATDAIMEAGQKVVPCQSGKPVPNELKPPALGQACQADMHTCVSAYEVLRLHIMRHALVAQLTVNQKRHPACDGNVSQIQPTDRATSNIHPQPMCCRNQRDNISTSLSSTHTTAQGM